MAKKTETTINVVEFNTGRVDFCIMGRTPLILNRMSEKTKNELLMPKGRKTAADKAGTLKHNPYQEFRDSPYLDVDHKAPTYLNHLASSFKCAIRGAGVDVPGSSKAQLGRLLWVEGERVSIYGVPKLFISTTRSSDINRTPDMRTRAIVPQWACKLSVSFMQPLLNAKVVGNLLAAAGLIQGVGDWRPEKGNGNYGQFLLVNENDTEYQSIIKNGGRQQQLKAMQNPEPYDHETADQLAWFDDAAEQRGLKIVK